MIAMLSSKMIVKAQCKDNLESSGRHETRRMAEFHGSWKYVSADNFDNYLKEIGVNVVLRKLAVLASPTVIFGIENESENQANPTWFMRTETAVKNAIARFKLNETFKETTIDDRKVDSEFSIEKEALIQRQKDAKGQVSVIKRELAENGTIMHVTITVNRVVSTALFKKIYK
ncbi:hypothetical protein TCAL_06157 [Tigriopus californicus]|uniref:Cytosolic fatty-acid binding proteins domain-containing protein n=1 Tax=Tigriopus californicus TaxID=6832 RepID=A0A553PLA5_TIGCA|nr:fatty acid-binding protein 9-like [Tigriopus californicus]TRY78458.1 hypothetical protein TCAL_06157 [Tigriopus californicus]|eukprot:TCALIF_06158-PA protein Name:"Similar to FABP9 Fatty acid-binding protein 9 (Homo sapiens)" AED:0.30 eAED:0.30 QI:181/1/1/1/1/1/2/55/172